MRECKRFFESHNKHVETRLEKNWDIFFRFVVGKRPLFTEKIVGIEQHKETSENNKFHCMKFLYRFGELRKP